MRLIDAKAVKKMFNAIARPAEYKGVIHMVVPISEIDKLPTVDAVPVVHGRWIHCNGKSNLWYCSECCEKILYNPTRRTYNIEKRPVHEVNKYCRGCGAKMEGERKNNES